MSPLSASKPILTAVKITMTGPETGWVRCRESWSGEIITKYSSIECPFPKRVYFCVFNRGYYVTYNSSLFMCACCAKRIPFLDN